jgi:hypothetical protein
VDYLVSGQLFPLEELIAFNIGEEGLKTLVGYPAAGSFTGFLIETYGLQRFTEAYALEGRTFEERERDDTATSTGSLISGEPSPWIRPPSTGMWVRTCSPLVSRSPSPAAAMCCPSTGRKSGDPRWSPDPP